MQCSDGGQTTTSLNSRMRPRDGIERAKASGTYLDTRKNPGGDASHSFSARTFQN